MALPGTKAELVARWGEVARGAQKRRKIGSIVDALDVIAPLGVDAM